MTDVDVFAVAVSGPPLDHFFVVDLIVSDFQIELRSYVIDPIFSHPKQDIGIEIIVVGDTGFAIASFRILRSVPPYTEGRNAETATGSFGSDGPV